MKKLFFSVLLLTISTMSYAKIGRHNFLINVGGGYQSLSKPETVSMEYIGGFPVLLKSPEYRIGGGLFNVELGYLLHSVRQNKIIHGFDLRAEFGMSFLSGNVYEGDDGKVLQKLNQWVAGFSMTYTLGRDFGARGRLMFDIIGYGLVFRSSEITRTAIFADSTLPSRSVKGSFTGPTAQYILPGVHYMMDNGFTVGWRNKVKINLGPVVGEGMYAFDTAFSIGFAFGGGSQPWQKVTDTVQ